MFERVSANLDFLAREEEVVKMIAEGHSSRAIADTLVISVKTVEKRISGALKLLKDNMLEP